MIPNLLNMLKETANAFMKAAGVFDDPAPEPIVFPNSESKGEHLDLQLGVVTLLLVNLEEDRSLRPDDPFQRRSNDGTTQRVAPAMPIIAHVLFAARATTYEQSLSYISLILECFRRTRVIDHENTPNLSNRIEKLTMELVTIPFSEQNHLWGLLRASYQPSLLYKVRVLVFQDEKGQTLPQIKDPTVNTSRLL